MMSGLFRLLSCWLVLFLLSSSSASEVDTVVPTSSGPVRGTRLTTSSGLVTAFLGIPYAEPPVGNLRFQKPRPHQPWNHTLEATSFGSSCYQESLDPSSYGEALVSLETNSTLPFSEDCLFVNIWVPHPRPSAPAPVLVWIHGGGFFRGSGSHDRSFLAATENIIVASMNYRLNALGFLSLPPDAPGNVGLWDQHLALRWLKENVAAFGGDPNRLTLGGQSAGAASVGFHLLSPVSQNLFAQAVLQSGASIAPWAWVSPEEAKVRGMTLGQILGCHGNSSRIIVSCLRRKQPGEFVQKLPILSLKILVKTFFVPTTDGEFLPDAPRKLLDAGGFPNKSVLTGFTSTEGSLFLSIGAPGFSLYNRSLISHQQLLEGLRLSLPVASNSTIRMVDFLYRLKAKGEAQYRNALVRATGDYFFLCPVAVVAGAMAEKGLPVFAYSFSHRPSFVSLIHKWVGVPHCSELPYIFGVSLAGTCYNITYPPAEVELSRRLMGYWGKFVRTGSPDGEKWEKWPVYTGGSFFQISTVPSHNNVPPTLYCDFWELLAHEVPGGSDRMTKIE